MTINKPKSPEWNLEYDKLVQQMTKFFNDNRIHEFLLTHLRINQLFTNKLQYSLDNTDYITHEYKIDASPDLIKKIDEFNTNLSTVLEQNKTLKIISKEEDNK